MNKIRLKSKGCQNGSLYYIVRKIFECSVLMKHIIFRSCAAMVHYFTEKRGAYNENRSMVRFCLPVLLYRKTQAGKCNGKIPAQRTNYTRV